jgi:cytochrome c
VAAIDFTVLPDGSGLPPGAGTVVEGRVLYGQQCVDCHGADGEGSLNDRLAGGVGSIGSDQPVKTVGSYWPYATTLFDYIRRAMPYQTPGSLSADDVYALTAYVLHLNGILEEGGRVDAGSLPEVQMPNRDGFVSAVPSD